MSKLIDVMSLKNGFGKSTLTGLIAMKLADLNFRVLAICNHKYNNDLTKYLLTECKYSIDDLRPHLDADSLDGNTLKLMSTKINTNLDIFAGSEIALLDNTLQADDLIKVKFAASKANYDYVIIDSAAKVSNIPDLLSVVDIPVIVTVPVNNQDHYLSQAKELSADAKENVTEYLKMAILVINFYEESLNFNAKNFKKYVDKENIFRFNYSPNVINFCNGLKYELEVCNEKELVNLVSKITNIDQIEQPIKKSNKLSMLRKLIFDK